MKTENVEFCSVVFHWVNQCLYSLPDHFNSESAIIYLPWILRKSLAEYINPGQKYSDIGTIKHNGFNVISGYENVFVAHLLMEEFEDESTIKFNFDYDIAKSQSAQFL